jgi:hypothetical protein
MSSALPQVEPSPLRLGDDPAGGDLLMHVTWRAFDGVHRVEDVKHLQRTVIAVVEKLGASPRVRTQGVFADVRGGFVLIQISRPQDLMEALAGLADVAAIEAHPVVEAGAALGHLRGMLVTEDLVG